MYVLIGLMRFITKVIRKVFTPPPENEKASHSNKTPLKTTDFKRRSSKARRLFLKFLIITPPAILLKITKRQIEDYKALGPFQNLDVGLLLNEAYGHGFSSSTESGCWTHIHSKQHEPKGCTNWIPGPGKMDTCELWLCGHQSVTQ